MKAGILKLSQGKCQDQIQTDQNRDMSKLFRIIVLLFTILITYINTAVINLTYLKSDQALSRTSFPYSYQFITVDSLLLINADFGSKIKISPDKFDKYSQKINFLWKLQRILLVNRYFNFSIKILQTSSTIFSVFSPPDICFPFNYFW